MIPRWTRLGSAVTAVVAGLLAAAVTVTSLGACGTSRPASGAGETTSAGVASTPPSSVPWLALQAPSPAPTTPSAPSSPPCSTNDVVVSPPSAPGFGLGSEYFGATVSLTSGSSCWLPSSPPATFTDASGAAIPIATMPGDLPSSPITLTSSTASASIRVQISDYQALPSVASVTLVLGDGSRLVLHVSGVSSGTGPGPASEAVYLVGIVVSTPAAPTAAPSMTSVAASLSTGGPAIAGHAYDFEVTLSNSSATATPLSPCPAYEEGLKGVSASISTYLLNCAAATPIPADGGETFAMQILIPPSTVPGQYTLTWGIVNSADAYANRSISVS